MNNIKNLVLAGKQTQSYYYRLRPTREKNLSKK